MQCINVLSFLLIYRCQGIISSLSISVTNNNSNISIYYYFLPKSSKLQITSFLKLQKLFFPSNNTQMYKQKYPNIGKLITQLKQILKQSSTSSQTLQLQLKYAQLKVPPDNTYASLINQSSSSILILNDRLGPTYKRYKINADSTNSQYLTIQTNCFKLTKPTLTKKLNLKLTDLKIQKLVNTANIQIYNKIQKWNDTKRKQYNLLINKKQFRLDFNQVSLALSQNSQLLTKKNYTQLIDQVNVARFIQSQSYDISPYYSVCLSEIYQTDQTSDLEQILTLLEQQTDKQIDDYILKHLPSHTGKKAKYEIELRMLNEGIKKLTSLLPMEDKMKEFLCDMMMMFRNLVNKTKNDTKKNDDIESLMKNIKIQ